MNKKYIYKLFVGLLTKKGHKVRAEMLFNRLLGMLRREYQEDPMIIIEELLVKIKFRLRLRPIIISGIVYRLPLVINEKKEYGLAVRWIMESARGMKGKAMLGRVYQEMVNIKEGTGASLKKKEEIYKTVFSNIAFLRYLEKRKHSMIRLKWLNKIGKKKYKNHKKYKRKFYRRRCLKKWEIYELRMKRSLERIANNVDRKDKKIWSKHWAYRRGKKVNKWLKKKDE